MTRFLQLSLHAVLVAVLTSSGVAVAQAPDLVELGRREYESGKTEFNLGNYEKALGHFETAYRLSGRPSLLYNLGVTQRRLFDRGRKVDRLTDAIDRFRAYLSSPAAADPANAAQRQRVIDDLREAEAVWAKTRGEAARGEEMLRVAEEFIGRLRLADAKAQLERFEAEPHLERVQAVQALMVRGRMEAVHGDAVKAKAAYLRALTLDRGAHPASMVEPPAKAAFAAAAAEAGTSPVVAVHHNPPSLLKVGQVAELGFELPSDLTGVVAGVEISYRTGTGAYARLPRTPLSVGPGKVTKISLPRDFCTSLPPGARIDYYIDVVDDKSAILDHLGTAALPFNLDVGARKKPIYKQWQLWTGLGIGLAVAAAGVGVGVALGQPPPSTSVPVRLTLLSW